MRPPRELLKVIRRFCLRHKVAAAGILLALILVVAGATYVSVEATSTVDFCIQCHEMGPAYTSYLRSSHYNVDDPSQRATCRDCHVPPWSRPASVLWTKTAHGVKDVYVHWKYSEDLMSPAFHEKMMAAAPAGIHNASCLKCHDDIRAKEYDGKVNIHKTIQDNDDSRCTDCHKDLVHYPYSLEKERPRDALSPTVGSRRRRRGRDGLPGGGHARMRAK